MTAASVSTAVATRDNSPAGLIQQYKSDFASVLPSHIRPDTWVRLATGALRRNPTLARAAENDVAAFLSALLEAARLGLEPGTEQFYLVPRKEKGVLKVAGMPGYQGEIELIYRAGAVSSVVVEVVRDADQFSYSPGVDERPKHVIDWDAEDRGQLRLVYAYAVMKDGATSKVVVLNRHHIATAKASSDGASSEYSPWRKHEEAMWMKTAVHRLRKWVPTSAEYRNQVAQAAVAADDVRNVHALPSPSAEVTHDATDVEPEIYDAEFDDADLDQGDD